MNRASLLIVVPGAMPGVALRANLPKDSRPSGVEPPFPWSHEVYCKDGKLYRDREGEILSQLKTRSRQAELPQALV